MLNCDGIMKRKQKNTRKNNLLGGKHKIKLLPLKWRARLEKKDYKETTSSGTYSWLHLFFQLSFICQDVSQHMIQMQKLCKAIKKPSLYKGVTSHLASNPFVATWCSFRFGWANFFWSWDNLKGPIARTPNSVERLIVSVLVVPFNNKDVSGPNSCFIYDLTAQQMRKLPYFQKSSKSALAFIPKIFWRKNGKVKCALKYVCRS